jgi:glutaredoxin
MKVEIYGAEWCGFCKEAVSLCKTKSIDYEYIDVDTDANLKVLEERMGSRVKSIPQIFKDGQLLPGGYTGLKRELAKN